MTETDRQFLREICLKIETKFPNVVAAFEGFVSSSLGGSSDGFLMVEIFNVSDDVYDNVLALGHTLANKRVLSTGEIISFRLWDIEETKKYFSEMLIHEIQ